MGEYSIGDIVERTAAPYFSNNGAKVVEVGDLAEVVDVKIPHGVRVKITTGSYKGAEHNWSTLYTRLVSNREPNWEI